MWVRGLKRLDALNYICNYQSHPMWVRGLKRLTEKVITPMKRVAPHVGAWIETSVNCL